MKVEKKVLWVDDEVKKLYESSKRKFLEKNIRLTIFDCEKDIVSELKKNHHIYDAIITDGLFTKETPVETDKLPNQTALNSFLTHLKTNESIYGKFPIFIYSGKTEIERGEAGGGAVLDTFNEIEIFKKNPEDGENGFKELCDAINKSDKLGFNLKGQYSKLLKILESRKFSINTFNSIIDGLKMKHLQPDVNDVQAAFNPIRKILEELLKKYNEHGLLPNEFIIKNQLNLSEARDYLSGKSSEWELDPPLKFSYNLVNLIQYKTSEESHHYKEPENFSNEELLNKLSITIYSLIDLIYDFDMYVSDSDISNNEKLHKKIEQTIEQTVIEQDDKNNYYCVINNEKILLSFPKIHKIYEVGQKIKVTKIQSNTNDRTNEIYKKFVKLFEINQ